MKVVLAGNPNVGKSVIFNALTGAHQHVANFPGCTVEHKEGKCIFNNREIVILDLPGTYSLSAYSEDERVSRKYLTTEKPDIVVNVIDASNLERNLFLTTQLLELEQPIIIVLNMLDITKSKGFELDINELSRSLNIPIIPMIATKGSGIIDLLNLILNYNFKEFNSPVGFYSDNSVIKKYENEIAAILEDFDKNCNLKRFGYNWLSLKILEQDEIVLNLIKQSFKNTNTDDFNNHWKKINETIKYFKINSSIEDTAVFIANERYKLINEIVEKVIIKQGSPSTNLTSMLDEVLTDKYLGIPIFLASLWAIFTFTFTLADPLIFLLEEFFSILSRGIHLYIPQPIIAELLVGVINGLGAIFVFIPNIFLLYFALALFEDSGYFARAAFLADKWLEKVGLHGKSFIPLMLGFGCTVPAIMATRSIKDKEDRLITLSIAPFISCSARLPVYVLFAGIFFPDFAGLAILAMYLLGIIVAIITAIVLNRFLYKHEDHVFIMELPEFQKPQFKIAAKEMWIQGSHFLRKAGTIIFLASLFVWIMSNVPFGAETENTVIAMIGKAFEPIFLPFGWGWEFISALLLGIIAKEVIVATLGILSGLNLSYFISGAMTISQALSFMSFVLLYTPCIATMSVIKSETKSLKITVLIGIGYIVAAYCVSLLLKIILITLGIP